MSDKKVVKGDMLYMVELPDGKPEQPPEKCYHCDKLQNYGSMCNLDQCDYIDKRIEYYPSIKPGWITLRDFIKKYHSTVSKTRQEYKNDYYKKIVQELPFELKDKPARTWFVLEYEFCIRMRIDYKGGGVNDSD